MEDKKLLSIISNHYPNQIITKIEDFSSGCDNWIYCFTFDKTYEEIEGSINEVFKIVLRLPKKLNDKSCPAMHLPKYQAFILNILNKNSIPAPKLLNLSSDNTYLIETFLPQSDLSKCNLTDEQELKHIFHTIGVYVKKLHSIDCCEKFGYVVNIDENKEKLIGKYDKWLELFENEFVEHIKLCLEKNLITDNMYQELDNIFKEVKPSLESYSEPKLLHSDICGNNIRVILKNKKWEFNGFIDFSDCMAGDPMYDLGEILLIYFGDWDVLRMIESGYGMLSNDDKKMIRFYALYYNSWLLSDSQLNDDIIKWRTTMKKLLTNNF